MFFFFFAIGVAVAVLASLAFVKFLHDTFVLIRFFYTQGREFFRCACHQEIYAGAL